MNGRRFAPKKDKIAAALVISISCRLEDQILDNQLKTSILETFSIILRSKLTKNSPNVMLVLLEEILLQVKINNASVNQNQSSQLKKEDSVHSKEKNVNANKVML